MKNKAIICIISLCLSLTISSCAQDKIISKENLPNEIKTFISIHFAKTNIAQAIEDNEIFSKTYEIILKNGTKLEFDSKNRIKEINSENKLPNSVINKSVLDYVKTNYQGSFITDWEIDDRKQKIGLNNGLNLEFSMKGQFLHIDD